MQTPGKTYKSTHPNQILITGIEELLKTQHQRSRHHNSIVVTSEQPNIFS
jgi:hypothetical protein